MNQTKKRLAIIKLAISMTDTETIQLQVLKLGLLKTDSKMREILAMLNEHNYAHAQRLISAYIEAPSDTVIQRTSQEERVIPLATDTTPNEEASPFEESLFEETKTADNNINQEKLLTLKEKIQLAKDKAIIEEFELFTTEESEEEIEDVNYDALLDIAPQPKKMSTATINYDSLLNVDAEDVLPNNIKLDISQPSKDAFFNEELIIKSDKTQKDDFFTPTEKTTKPFNSTVSEIVIQEKTAQEDFDKKDFIQKVVSPSMMTQDTDEINTIEAKNNIVQANDRRYKAIPYINQKFKNMMNQYPPNHQRNTIFDSVNNWLAQISNEGYTEAEIENTIKKTEELSHTNKAESAQLLLACAATESKYAQFRLARALFKGDLLQQNLAEAFTLINRLAMNDDYPEAICDLGQFYENGLGISKDKKKAEELYKEAMDLGINRAIDHYERIRKEKKGLFSVFRK